jgi:sugar O-acyltransferase (sialic acid O-acetyltransferase NeuD family)
MNRLSRRAVLLGLESRFGHEVLDILASAAIDVLACVRSVHDTEVAGSYPLHCFDLAGVEPGAEFLVPLLTPGRRKLRVDEAHAYGLVSGKPVFHPMSVCSPTSLIGAGSIISPMTVIGSHTVAGDYLIMNRAATIGHDCTIGGYCTLGPASVMCGACVLEDGVYVGAGAVLCPKVHVGRNAVISAGAVVNRDVPAHTLVAGNPARTAKTDIAGYRDIGV